MTLVIIARHGNTFEDGEEPRRVGKRTDLPLTAKGRQQGRSLGRYLLDHNLLPDKVYTSTLIRTQETARCALMEAGIERDLYPMAIFDEIDYGPDENQPESAVISRIGINAISNWEINSIIPDGWIANTSELLKNWDVFFKSSHIDHNLVLVLTSNGIARFAPQLADNYEKYHQNTTLKLSTGALGIIRISAEKREIIDWNIKPPPLEF